MSTIEVGIKQIAEQVQGRLQRYLEAQYHIRDPETIAERRALLAEPGAIAQRPHVEVTPSYELLPGFTGLAVPPPIRDLLHELAQLTPTAGVYPQPFRHQAEALEAFFRSGPGDDLVVATGTGSGKTEVFLYIILGLLAREAAERRASYALPGVRALLLYPMNALVSDQTARLRRLLGDERVADAFRRRGGRHPLFGMYTSRTPYPGVRAAGKDSRHLKPIFEYFEGLAQSTDPTQQALMRLLRSKGRWPAKDVVQFFGRDQERARTYRTGRAYTERNWDTRFLTAPGDRELVTRHEMQLRAPDLLVTNYSMLEYMLLRPIERSIFAQTRAWLESNPKNQLLLVLDEAHMYRGVGGAEVGLLIRRLHSRLGISRDRLRCILTSASIGSDDAAKQAALTFAAGLTGRRSAGGFRLIEGTKEPRSGARPGSPSEARGLALADPRALAAASIALDEARALLTQVAEALGWAPPAPGLSELELRQWACQRLTGFGPLELLIARVAANATDFDALAAELFPGAAEAHRATDGLLALGNFARRTEPGRHEQPLLPTRVHLLFRGLPPVYACINERCEFRRAAPPSTPRDASLLVGRLFTEPRTSCDCGARVFELLTHRDCGAAFIRCFSTEARGDFLWHERGGVLTTFGAPLHEVHILLEEPQHPDHQGDVDPIWVHMATGRVVRQPQAGARLCFRPTTVSDGGEPLTTFSTCPICTRQTRSGGRNLKIMDLATKGEQPFANLIREQFGCQVATETLSELHPNEGRKALLFSDGRQKAARLARDLPREVERDSFREALVLAARDLRDALQDRASLDRLYPAIVSVCTRHHLHFFDGESQKQLIEECTRFRTDYDADLAYAIGDGDWRPAPPVRYRQQLMRQICDPYYSLTAACGAVVVPREAELRRFQRRVSRIPEERLREIVIVWTDEMLAKYAFDPELSLDARRDTYPYFQPVAADETLRHFFVRLLQGAAGLDAAVVNDLRGHLFDFFTAETPDGQAGGRMLKPQLFTLQLALDDPWHQCRVCGNVQWRTFFDGLCVVCLQRQLEPRPPTHGYMVSRKGFFREPLRAVLTGQRPVHINAEEHTAQLSQRDAGVIYATTEEFELRFQDVVLADDKPPVDILSCTTTMEVGIDIGSLTAVGMRTVPPQRENYQQRAGRAGRRGVSVSSVLTFAQGGPHDAFYFANPHTMISGPPRTARIKIDNQRLARRHIHSYLLQTFFHETLDGLDADQVAALAGARSNLMSAFGDAAEFIRGTGPFSLGQYLAWQAQAIAPSGAALLDVCGWLPDEMFPGVSAGAPLVAAKQAFVREVAGDLAAQLQSMDVPPSVEPANDDDDDDDMSGTLIDVLFDRGILPSYAFPTSLCSFVIHHRNERGRITVKERPQLAKAQALSEYAPGRLLVVNKQTYRVGGIFVEGPPTASPAVALFAEALTHYVGCTMCTFVRLVDDPTDVGDQCPVCGGELRSREMLDPPGFSPERGRPVPETDREQEITYATLAQLPEIADQNDFDWQAGAGQRLEHAYGEDVLLVVANKGHENEGFVVCESCGGAWVQGEQPQQARHPRPFLIEQSVLRREQADSQCNGNLRPNLYLGSSFKTDLLLLRIRFAAPLEFDPGQPWLNDALTTLAEALTLAASLHLDIDPGELAAGFRLARAAEGADSGFAEVYLYDTSSGGAGYAVEAGAELQAVLDHTERLLARCESPDCTRSCPKCLRHYGNRFLHPKLDRRLGLQVLRYARHGELPQIASSEEQAQRLRPLAKYLELEGWRIEAGPSPLTVALPSGQRLAIGCYPILLASSEAEERHAVASEPMGVLVPDYVVEHDLPNAYRRVREASAAAPRPRRSSAARVHDFPFVEMSALLASQGRPTASGTVRLPAEPAEDLIAVRMPIDGLAGAGVPRSAWLIVRLTDHSAAVPGRWLIARRDGEFTATRNPWTVAFLRRVLADTALVSYQAGGADYRPERLPWSDVRVIGHIEQIVLGAP